MLNEASILKTRRRQKRLILPNFEPWRKPRVHVYFRKSWLTMNRPFPPFCGLKPQTLVFFKSKYHIVSKQPTTTRSTATNLKEHVNSRAFLIPTRMVGIFVRAIKRLQKVKETEQERIANSKQLTDTNGAVKASVE